MEPSQSVRTWALIKSATFQYTDGPHGPQNRQESIGKTSPGTVTAQPRKGQKSIVTKHSNVPIELRAKLRRVSSKNLARKMRKAGGSTSKDGQAFTAVLEERGVNPNLAEKNPTLAKALPNDVYKPRNVKTASAIRIYNIIK
tara:strand:- start:1444 stop:1869 length:426 start_codon:yes stop_codon:yes gene_type:complete